MPSNSMQLRPGQTGICGPAEASGQNHPHQAHRHQQGAPFSQDLPPQGEGGGRDRRTHSHSPPPSPAPSSTPSPQQHAPPPPNAPQGRKNREGGGETGQGERDEQREVTGQGRPRSPKTVQSTEGGEGKEKRERIFVVRSPCQENSPADAHPSAHKSVLESAYPAWTQSVHLDSPGQRHGQQPVSWTADPGVVKQDKSSRGSVDTTKTRLGPQRVRMGSGERPIGAAKGKQSDTEALCQPPPPPPPLPCPCAGAVQLPLPSPLLPWPTLSKPRLPCRPYFFLGPNKCGTTRPESVSFCIPFRARWTAMVLPARRSRLASPAMQGCCRASAWPESALPCSGRGAVRLCLAFSPVPVQERGPVPPHLKAVRSSGSGDGISNTGGGGNWEQMKFGKANFGTTELCQILPRCLPRSEASFRRGHYYLPSWHAPPHCPTPSRK